MADFSTSDWYAWRGAGQGDLQYTSLVYWSDRPIAQALFVSVVIGL